MTTLEKIIATNPQKRNKKCKRRLKASDLEILADRREKAVYSLNILLDRLIETSKDLEYLVNNESIDLVELKALELDEIHEKIIKCISTISIIDD